MEQMISIKYINNLINLDFEVKESKSKSYIYSSYEDKDNHSLLKIMQLEILKSKIVILLSNNEILLYDHKSEKICLKNAIDFKIKNFNEIRLIKVYSDQLFIILNTHLAILDQNNLEVLRYWDLGEKFYYFSLFEEFNPNNLEIIYVNDNHELKFFNKGLVFEPKIRNLYKENIKIDVVLYQNGLLMWSSGTTIKVFDLEKKKMLMRKNYKESINDESVEKLENLEKIENNENNEKLEKIENIEDYQSKHKKAFSSNINVILFEKFLCVNSFQKIVYIYKINESKIEEIFRSEDLSHLENDLYIGFWLNSALTKISIIKNIYSKINANSMIKLEIFKIPEKNEPISLNTNNNLLIYSKSFDNILSTPPYPFKFSFSQKYALVYIYNNEEFFFITLMDKTTKLLEDLKENKNFVVNFNDLYNIFSKLNNFNEKCYIASKLVRNIHLFLNNPQIDQSKLIYLINSIITNEKMLNYFTLILIKTAKFEFCFSWMNKSLNKISSSCKEKIIEYLLKKKKFEMLSSFISDQNEIILNEEFDKFLYDSATDVISSNSNLTYIYALLSLKRKNFETCLEFLLKIKYESGIAEKIYKVLIENENCEDLIFKFEELFKLFNEHQLIEILDTIFNKEIDLKMCNDFYSKLFEIYTENEKFVETNNNYFLKCDTESVLYKFISEIILKQKFYLIVNSEIAEKILEILFNVYFDSEKDNLPQIEENYNSKHKRGIEYFENYDLINKFLKNYDNEKLEFKEFLRKYNEEGYLNKKEEDGDKNFLEVLILILSKTEEYERIINIYLDRLKDPEKAVNFIENSVICEKRREVLYTYLTKKIKESNYLSSAKKLYFINLFQDNVCVK